MIDYGGVDTGARAGTGPKNLEIADLSVLEALLPWTVALLGAKSSFGSLETMRPHKEFLWQVIILRWSGKRKSSKPFQMG